jgi:hypothetical protein
MCRTAGPCPLAVNRFPEDGFRLSRDRKEERPGKMREWWLRGTGGRAIAGDLGSTAAEVV